MIQKAGVKKSVFITGSSGFLGRYLIKFSPNTYHIIAHYRSKRPNGYDRDLTFVELDFGGDFQRSLRKLKPTAIIHTAAMASIDECEVKPEIARRINFEATRLLADFSAETGSRFIFISSDVVFDGKKGYYSETDVPTPGNVYAHTKVEAEKYILANHPNAVVVRPALFYGYALNGRPSFTEVMLENLKAGKQIFLFKDQYRTPVLINNLTAALWEVLELDYTGILHIGGTQKISRLDMGLLLCEMFNLDKKLLVPVKLEDARLLAFRPLDCSLNSGLAQRLLKANLTDCRTGFNLAYR